MATVAVESPGFAPCLCCPKARCGTRTAILRRCERSEAPGAPRCTPVRKLLIVGHFQARERHSGTGIATLLRPTVPASDFRRHLSRAERFLFFHSLCTLKAKHGKRAPRSLRLTHNAKLEVSAVSLRFGIRVGALLWRPTLSRRDRPQHTSPPKFTPGKTISGFISGCCENAWGVNYSASDAAATSLRIDAVFHFRNTLFCNELRLQGG